jgi:hypothetical protein
MGMTKPILALSVLGTLVLACATNVEPPIPQQLDQLESVRSSRCNADSDCQQDASVDGDLCYNHRCYVACNTTVNSDCPSGKSCVFVTNPSTGTCYKHPGCNPPPAGTFCPSQCYGVCE